MVVEEMMVEEMVIGNKVAGEIREEKMVLEVILIGEMLVKE